MPRNREDFPTTWITKLKNNTIVAVVIVIASYWRAQLGLLTISKRYSPGFRTGMPSLRAEVDPMLRTTGTGFLVGSSAAPFS
jgi:hypothetical protein